MNMRKGKLAMSFALLVFMVGFVISATPIVLAVDGLTFFEAMVPMSDSIELYTRVYLPGPGAYPVILMRTPYGIGTPTWYGGVPPDTTNLTQWPHEVLNGYAYVSQDTRGRYYSEGLDRLFYDDIADGHDTLNWIGNQSWCDGNIGISGYSAPGITAFLAAAEPHPYLKAIVPLSSSGNLENDLTFDGGAFRGDALFWGLGQTAQGLSLIPDGHVDQLGLSAPEYWYHVMQLAGVITDLVTHLAWHSGLDSFYPNATGSEWWMHLPLIDFHPSYAALQPYAAEVLSHPDEDDWRNHFKVYDTVNVPTLLLTGWYDFFVKCQVDAFVALQSRGVPVKLLVGDGTHGNPGVLTPYYEWFDYWLKGIDTGIVDEPPVLYYCLEADEWRWADQWPPGGVEYTNYYLHDGGVLSTDLCADGEASDSYVYDLMDPVLTMGGTNLIVPPGSFDQTPVVLGRDDILSYTSPPLTEDVEIAGPLTAVISASSNCTDTDFTAKLIDVHPTGELMLVADGIIRARYRDSMADPELMTPGHVYEFTIDLGDIGQVFEAGHCIRVDISSSNFPKHDRNLNTGGELYKETEVLTAENTIYHDAENPSYISLPIVSPKPRVFEGCIKIVTPELTYEGPGELHTYEHAVYLHLDDGQWIKWDISFHLKLGKVEFYSCKGELGRLLVTVVHTKDGSYATAVGRKVFFYGRAT